MQTSVTFKNLDPSNTLRDYVCDKLDRLDKFLDNPAEANVVLSVEKFRQTAEVNLVGDRLNVIGKEQTEDMYSAIDMVLDKLVKQIKKNKQKIKKHRNNSKSAARKFGSDFDEKQNADTERQIFVTNIDYKPMSIEEAAMQMELIDDDFLVFMNSRSDRVNVLYNRNDGHLGLIEPSI
ncbi:MAG: ribosome-associated translation inhibitor RaiA [Desulfobacterales bacterium]|nr:ribosome-associated translation inhibitor RaiA [Desulfobacterales bacterium]